MKRVGTGCLGLALWIGIVAPAFADSVPWSAQAGVAETLPEARGEIGIFQPLRYGLTEDIEIGGAPLISLLAPSLDMRKQWGPWGPWTLTTGASLSFPSGLIHLLACEGTGCLYPADTEIPFFIGFTEEVLVSRRLPAGFRATLRVGWQTGLAFGENTLPSIDLPIAHSRFAHLVDGYSLVAGTRLDGPIWGPLHFHVDLDVWGMPASEGTLALEHLGMITWRATPGFAMQAGYVLVWGRYPYGENLHVLPLVDLLWAFGD